MSGPGRRTPHIDAPPHLAPKIGLLASASDESAKTAVSVEGSAGEQDTADVPRWMNGIVYTPEACGVGNGDAQARPFGCAPFDDHEAEPKDIDPHTTPVETDPFFVFAGDTCSTMGWEAHDYLGRARRALETAEQFLVEQEFFGGAAAQAGIAAGVDYPTDQWLANAAADVITTTNIAATGPPKPYQALGAISDYFASCAGGARGMIHIAIALLPAFVRNGVVRREGNIFLTPDDHIVVPGSGYGTSSKAGVTATAGTAWIYATGPVRFWRNTMTITPDTYAEALDRDGGGVPSNSATFRSERMYLVDWDRCCHGAVLIDRCDDGCPT